MTREIRELAEAAAKAESMNRRSFVTRLGMAGGVLALGPLLQACGSEGGGAAGGASGDAFSLGTANARTGPLASTYAAYMQQADLAISEINADGGIDGGKIKVVRKDDQADPAKEPGVFRQFTQEKIPFVIGPNSSATCLAALPISTASKIVNLCVATADDLSNPQKYPYSFVIGPSMTPASVAMVDYSVSKGWNKIAVLYSDDAFGQGHHAAIKKHAAEAGAQLVAEVEHAFDSTNMQPFVAQVVKADPDVVIAINAAVATESSMLKGFKNLGYDGPIIGTTGISKELTRKAAPPEVYKNVHAIQLKAFSYTASEPVGQRQLDFVKQVRASSENMGGLTSTGLVYGLYDFVHMLNAAVDKAGSRDPQKVTKALETLGPYDGVNGKIEFSPDSHDGIKPEELVVVKAASGDSPKSEGGYLLERAQ